MSAIVLVLIGATALTPNRAHATALSHPVAQSEIRIQPTVSVVASYELFTFALSPICLRFNSDNTIVGYLVTNPSQPMLGSYFGDPAVFASFLGAGGAIGTSSGFVLPGFALMQLRVSLIGTLAIGFPAVC